MQLHRKNIIVFSPYKKAIGVFTSIYQTAKALNKPKNSIHYACTGHCMSCGGFYFRYLPPHISIEQAFCMDLPTFDKINGIERKLYATGNMSRKGMKYNKRKQ